MVNVLDEKIRVARKEHKCGFCGDTIHIGDDYNWQKCVFEGLLYVWKAHPSCCDIASELSMYDDADEGVTMDFFKETIFEVYNTICDPNEKVLPPFEVQLLTVKQKFLNK